jgi:hypothetical protein
VAFTALTLSKGGSGLHPGSFAVGLQGAIFIGFFAAFLWCWGLVCVGLPFWAALHGAGIRNGRAAGALRAALSFSVALQLGHDLQRHGTFFAQPPLLESMIGALLGGVVWRRAYTPAR